MSYKQLKRLNAINLFSMTNKLIRPINYTMFAILNDDEREQCLKAHEDVIAKIEKSREKDLLNYFKEYRCWEKN